MPFKINNTDKVAVSFSGKPMYKVVCVDGETETTVWESDFAYDLLSDGTYSIKANPAVTLDKAITLPLQVNGKSISEVGEYGFAESGITQLVLPEGITTLQRSAFRRCNNLTVVDFPGSITTMETYAFYYSDNITDVYVRDVDAWINLTNTIKYGNITLPNADGKLHVYKKNNSKELTEINVADGVDAIGSNAFRNAKNITKVTMPDSLVTIRDWAFSNCSGLTSIDARAIKTIENYAYWECHGFVNIVLPDTVQSIGDYAFGYCTNLTSIVIPTSVTTIGEQVFQTCSRLTTIYYKGSQEQWTQIQKHEHNDKLMATEVIYNYAG